MSPVFMASMAAIEARKILRVEHVPDLSNFWGFSSSLCLLVIVRMPFQPLPEKNAKRVHFYVQLAEFSQCP